MSALSPLPAPGRAVGPVSDAMEQTLADVISADAHLFSATLRHDAEAIRVALEPAKRALATAESRRMAFAQALSPALDEVIKDEVKRLVRAWPQEKRGDLAGYGAELAILVLEHRPSRRALEVAFRELKLGLVHLPSISEVVRALTAVETRLANAVAQIDRLPDRIQRAEAMLARERPPVAMIRGTP